MGGHAPDLGVFSGIPELREWITKAKLATAAEMGGGKVEGVAESDHEVPVSILHLT
jgi:hypothetical protein